MRLSKAMAQHLDREMQQAIILGREISAPSARYPEVVRRAMEVAYATYFRTLLEFFHDGGSTLRLPRSGKTKRDIHLADVLPGFTVTPFLTERRRFRQTDKLAAHLSRYRSRYGASKKHWGCPADCHAIERRIGALLRALPGAAVRFPLAAEALS